MVEISWANTSQSILYNIDFENLLSIKYVHISFHHMIFQIACSYGNYSKN